MRWTVILLSLNLGSCAVLYKVAITDIDTRYHKGHPIDIKLSETGVNLKEAAQVADSFRGGKDKKAEDIAAIIALFQWGPKVGNIVFNENYDANLADLIYQQCPSGKITELMSVREMRKYPIVSGEIVRVKGWCADE